MSNSALLEVFGHILFSFTRGVADHFNSDEPEFTAESFGYTPLESTGREWYRRPVDEFIYQEYSDGEVTSLEYLTRGRLGVRVINACSWEEKDKEEKYDENRTMAWKRLRPSALRTVCKSMYTGALISVVTAVFIGTIYIMVTYLSFKTVQNCEFQPMNSTSIQIQWIRTISDVVSCSFLYIWFFALVQFLFRPFQLTGVRGKLLLICLLTYSLDTSYRVALQASGLSHSRISFPLKIPLNALFLLNQSVQVCVLTNTFCTSAQKKLALFFKIVVPSCLIFLVFVLVTSVVYPIYNRETAEKKLLIAVFAPLIGVLLKVASRLCVQKLYNITHPGYSYVLLSPLYCGSAIVFRVLQAELDSLRSIAILGIIHGAAEVIERSTMVLIDHICYVLCKRAVVPWKSFRTPRRERLTADIAIMGMVYESTAIVSVNGCLYLYQFVYASEEPFKNLFQSFAIHTTVSLAIEWVFTSLSLAIETRYQNMPVMAVWCRRWRRHILVAIVNAVPVALWASSNLIDVLHGRFSETSTQPCKMPFT